jgi:ribosome-binding factor A
LNNFGSPAVRADSFRESNYTMKRKKASRKDLLSSCAEIGPDDNVDPRTFFQKRATNKTNRKALQLCSEVAKTVSYALAWELGDDVLGRLQVESVVPAPDSTHLLITVSLTEPSELVTEDILKRLRHVTGKLRALVAASIHRRRVPDLAFHLTMGKEVDQ